MELVNTLEIEEIEIESSNTIASTAIGILEAVIEPPVTFTVRPGISCDKYN